MRYREITMPLSLAFLAMAAISTFASGAVIASPSSYRHGPMKLRALSVVAD